MYSIQSTENSQAQYKEEQASLVCTDSLIAVLHWPLFFLDYWIYKKTNKQTNKPKRKSYTALRLWESLSEWPLPRLP